MFKHCPGLDDLIRPEIIIVKCPNCGGEVEFFGYELEQKCPSCGTSVCREAKPSCVTWCNYADKCIDDLEAKGLISKETAAELRKIAKKPSLIR